VARLWLMIRGAAEYNDTISQQFVLISMLVLVRVLILGGNRRTRSAVLSVVSRTAGCLLGFGVLIFEYEFEDEKDKDRA
jgi:hypothetical protein